MKAAVLVDFNKPLTIRDVPTPKPGPGEVLVKVAATGICHSDLHTLKGEWFPVGEGFILGHEVSGWVEEFGPDTKNPYGLSKGDPVIVSWIVPCGVCKYCASGRENYCPMAAGRIPGIVGLNGGHAEYMVIPEIAVVPADRNLDIHYSAPISCAYGTAYGALKSAGARGGMSIVIVGTGGVGSAAVQLASVLGMYPIVAVDVVDSKLRKAKELGATHTVNAEKEDPVQRIREILPDGAEVVYETKPNPDLKVAQEVVERGGTVVVTGLGAATWTFSVLAMTFVGQGFRLVGSLGYRPRVDLPEIIRLAASGKLDVRKLVTHEYVPEDINRAYENLEKGLHVRAIVRWA